MSEDRNTLLEETIAAAERDAMESAVLENEDAEEELLEEKPEKEKKEFGSDIGEVEGFLDISDSGFGFLRFNNFLTSDEDVYVPASFIRKYGLRTGDKVKGKTRKPRGDERFGALIYILTVNGEDPQAARRRKHFDALTPIFPDEKIVLEHSSIDLSTRVMDLVAPIGRGQRGLIVAPPKAGKTVLLKKIATSIEAKYPDIDLIVLLIDERPEEVTDMKRSLSRAEVIYSTFDEHSAHHIKVASMVMERAKRMAESGKDVVILLDSITRLARAYNLESNTSGRTMSGGLDPSALHLPKKFFGTARNIEEGGSVTILATALIETGSRMDDVIYEEFKGTGNMELHLDRKMSELRIFPALDLVRSGTRREDLLLTAEEFAVMVGLRRKLSSNNNKEVYEAIEEIIDTLSSTKDNKSFIAFEKKKRM